MKKLLTLITGLLCYVTTFSQAVSINSVYFNNTLTYFPGGSISIHINPAGVFPRQGQFTLQLTDAAGTVINNNIGRVNEFFIPVLNGVLPVGLAPGNYRLRVVSTDAAGNILVTATSPVFAVGASASFPRPQIGNPSATIKVNCFTGPDNFFGYVDRANSDLTTPNILSITNYNASYTYTVKLITKTGTVTDLPVTVTFGNASFTIPAGLVTDYYTIEVTASNGGFSSSYSYIYQFNTGNTSLGNTSSENVCVNQEVHFAADIAVIQKNYPGSYYTINYGDGSVTDTFTHAQILLNNLKHTYTTPTCSAGSLTTPGRFTVELNLYNKGVRVGTNPNCDSYTRNGNGTRKFVNTSAAPVAELVAPEFSCLNTGLTIVNASIGGYYGSTNVCERGMNVTWYLKQPAAIDWTAAPAGWSLNGNKDLIIPASILNQTGVWHVKLVTQNPEGCITSSEDSDSFCIEPPLVPDFKLNMLDSVAGCAPFSISVTNLTNANICRKVLYAWSVLDSTGVSAAPSSAYTISNDTARNPTIIFHTPGNYFLSLGVGNTCGSISKMKKVKILGVTNVTFPSNKRYCNTNRTIFFGADPAHTPVYNQSSQPGDSYNWVIAGGPFSFVNGTSANSRYPTVLFTGYGTYTVSLTYTNSCGSKTVQQQIILDEPLVVDAGPNSRTVCFNTDSIHLSGAITGLTSSLSWTAVAPAAPATTGSFTNNAALNTIYTFSNQDKTRGEVWLILKGNPPSVSQCGSVSDTIKIIIQPKLYAHDGTKSICNTNSVGYTPTGRQPAATYNWTSSVVSGTVTGNGSGTGVINDVLSNTGSTSAIVMYFVVPSFNGCIGDTGFVTVTVHPTPVVTIPADVDVCVGTVTGSFNFTSTVSGTLFNWTNSDASIGLAASGTGNIASFTAVNNSGVSKTATITVSPVANGCAGVSKTFTITVRPGPPAADAGNDQVLCAVTAASLSAGPTGSATGMWTQVGGNAVTIADPASAATQLSGLVPNTVYSFVWTVDDISTCPPTTDTVRIYNRPAPTTANAGADTSYCNFTSNFSRTLRANAPAHAWESGSWVIASNTTGVTPAFSAPSDPSATISSPGLATGISTGNLQLVWRIMNDAGCVASTDTVNITITRKPVAGAILPVADLCKNSNTSLTLNNYEGVILKWRVKSAPFNNGYADSLHTTSTLNLNNLLDSVMVQAIVRAANGACTNTDTATVMIPVNSISEGGVSLKDSVYCIGNSTGTVTLTGYNGNISWQRSLDNGSTWSAIAGANGSALPYNNLSATTWFRAIVQQPGCVPDTSTVTKITVTGTAGVSDAGADKKLCAADSVLLTGNAPAGANYAWKQISGNLLTHSDSTQSALWVHGLQPGQQYRFEYSISNGICPPSKDSVSIIVFAPLVNKITPLTDTICSGQPVTITSASLSGGDATAYTFLWQTSTDGISWMSAGSSASLTFTPTASVYVRRLVGAGPCSGYSDTAFIVVEQVIANNIINANHTICINTAADRIVGSVPGGGSGAYAYQWQQSTDGISWTNITDATFKDYEPHILIQTKMFRRLVSDTRCGSAQSNIVTVTVRPDAFASFNPVTTAGCTPFTITPAVINLQPNAANATYQWYANNVLLGTGQNFPGHTLLNDGDSVDIKLVTTSPYGCKSDSMRHRFFTYPSAVPAFTLSTGTACGPAPVVITNNTLKPAAFTYLWNFGNGQTSTAQDPGTVIFQPSVMRNDTSYNVSLTVFSTCDTQTLTKQVVVKSKPKALFAPDKTVGCSPFKVIFSNNSLGLVNNYSWDFGDGTVVNRTAADTISHVFHTGVRDTFYVKLKAFNDCGVDSLQYAVIVSANTINLDFAVNGNQQQGCAPQTVSFVNNTRGATNFQWTFGDGNSRNTTKNIDTVTHTFTQPGIYQVLLRATNGCSDTTGFETITVYPKPVARFALMPPSVCVGAPVSFTNSSDSATSYLWQFGDGVTSTLTNPSHSYNTPGTYTVILTAFRVNAPGNTCSDIKQQTVQVTGTQPGSFTTADTLGSCLPFTATFRNTILPSVTATWNFGDGQTGSGDVVTHTYTAKGVYTVTLTSTVTGGCTYVSSRQVVVRAPAGQLIYTGGYNCNQVDTRFEVSATGTDSITWNFGDGQSVTTTQTVVHHRYNSPGNYLPSVVLKSNAGCQVQVPGQDTIKIDRIVPGITITEFKNCGSSDFTFKDTTHVFFGKAGVEWFFGDGGSATGNTVTHRYTSSGVYNLRRIVTSASGCKDTLNRQLNVILNTKPDASIVAPASACVGIPVMLNANVQSIAPVAVVKWTTSNGITGNAADLSAVFSTPGSYAIELIAGTAAGCFDTTVHSLQVNPSPNVISSADLTLCRGNTTSLNATGAGALQWSPATGLSCTTCPNPIATPLVTTSYVVSGTNSFGCVDTDTVVVTVMQPFDITVSGNDSICIGANTTLVAGGATSYIWSPASSLNSTNASSVIATPAVTTTYRVIGFDGANCYTDTAFVTVAVGKYPVIDLGPDQVVASGAVIPLVSTIQNGPIANWAWSASSGLSCDDCPLPVATISQDISYKVKVTTAFGCSTTDTIRFKTFCKDAQAFIPNAFTPDGDGVNDILMVRGSGIVTVKTFRIFNRWGEVVFERANFPPNSPAYGWDGKVNGIASGPEVYVYTAEVICGNGTSFTYKGNVSVLK